VRIHEAESTEQKAAAPLLAFSPFGSVALGSISLACCAFPDSEREFASSFAVQSTSEGFSKLLHFLNEGETNPEELVVGLELREKLS
jgi:hypothetical protein